MYPRPGPVTLGVWRGRTRKPDRAAGPVREALMDLTGRLHVLTVRVHAAVVAALPEITPACDGCPAGATIATWGSWVLFYGMWGAFIVGGVGTIGAFAGRLTNNTALTRGSGVGALSAFAVAFVLGALRFIVNFGFDTGGQIS